MDNALLGETLVVLLHNYLNTRLIFSKGSNVQILDTHDDFNAPVHVSYAYIEVQKNSKLLFENNTGVLSGAMAFMGALISFTGTGITMSFIQNRGISGGAFAFYDKARLDFGNKSEVQMTFIDNSASKVGGAIFVKDVEHLVIGPLGGNEPFLRIKMLANVTFILLGDMAELAGCAIYGGWIDATLSTSKIPNITIVSKDTCNSSIVSSNPKRLCVCTNLVPDCNITSMQFDHIPGQPFFISAVAVGQRFGIVPSTVQAQFISPKSTGLLEETQYVQIADKKCTQLTYTIRSSNTKEKITLIIANDDVEGPGLINVPHSELLFDILKLTFNLKECPYGFNLILYSSSAFVKTLSLIIKSCVTHKH